MSNSEMEKTLESTSQAPDAPQGRRYGGVALAEREAQRRAALIDAATEVFGTVGFRRATVRAVCRGAKLNDRYFYAAFDSLEQLLRATYEHHARALLGRLHAAVDAATGPLGQRLDAGLHAFFDFLRAPHAARVLLLEVMGVSPETDLTYQRYLFEFARLIMGLAQSGEGGAGHTLRLTPAASDDAEADARIVGLALVGAMTNAGTAWVLTGYQDPESRMVACCRRVVLGALAAP